VFVPTRASRTAPVVDRSRESVLRACLTLLVRTPELSLGDLASAIGIGRTTLHRMFAGRGDLITALAHQALDDLESTYRAAGFGSPEVVADSAAEPASPAVPAADVPAADVPAADVLGQVYRLVGRLIPLGPSLMFLIRARELDRDTDLTERIRRLDRPLHEALAAAGRDGVLDPHLPPWWVAETLFATVWIAWEQVAEGRLAARDAQALVIRTWLGGAAAPGGAGEAARS
jgi:AcrR family transcriptional regulator